MDEHVKLPSAKKEYVMNIKKNGQKIFLPDLGGSYEEFEKRPLRSALIEYAALDVFFFDELRTILFEGQTSAVKDKILMLSEKRLTEHESRNYEPKSRAKAIAPSF
jgi:exonuclease 3'-5' domain-containing protein 1